MLHTNNTDYFKKRSSMKIEQIYTGCLAQGAYYIESDGEAAVIDPLRAKCNPTLRRLKKIMPGSNMCSKPIFMPTL